MQITREILARTLDELEIAARNYRKQTTRVVANDPASIARDIIDTANADTHLASAIGEAQAVLLQLKKDEGDRRVLRQAFAGQGEAN